MTTINSQIPINDLTLTGVIKEDGIENMGGMTIQGWIALRSEIATYPALKSNPTSVEDLVELEGEYEMNDGKYFIPVEAIVKTAQRSYENQGELEGQSFKPTGAFKIMGATKAKTAGYARLLNSCQGVFIQLDNDGNRVVIGDKMHPAYFKASGDTGTDPTNRSEVTFEVTSDSFCPVMLYYGSIPLSETESVPAIES